MSTNIDIDERPGGAGRAWLIGIFLLAVIIGVALYITHPTPKEKNDNNEFAGSPGAGAWADKEGVPLPVRPAPAPTVSAPPLPPVPPPHLVQAPHQVFRQGPTCDQACEARQRLLAQAQGSEMTVKFGSNTLELNQPPPIISIKPGRPHTVAANSWLYAVLQTAISSDRPGDVLARVSQDIRDTTTQTELLIPSGSILHGKVKQAGGTPNTNDPSIMVLWDSLNLPNGGEVQLPNLPSADVDGAPGLSDQFNRHIAQTWIPSIAIAGITAAGALATTPTYGSYQGYSPTSEAFGQFGSTLTGRATSNLTQMLQQVRPTITIRKGSLVRVLVTRDLSFNGEYQQ